MGLLAGNSVIQSTVTGLCTIHDTRGFAGITNSITAFFHNFAEENNFVVRYDNDPRETPVSGVWMNVSVGFGSSYQVEIGVPTFRNIGIFNVRIKVAIGGGLAGILNIADEIAEKFKTVIIDEIISFQTPRIEIVGRVEDNYQVNVICPFQVDN